LLDAGLDRGRDITKFPASLFSGPQFDILYVRGGCTAGKSRRHRSAGNGIMYAVIKTGGKQYRVAKDDTITVERLPGDEGGEVTLDQVLMVGGDSPKIGTPTVDGASVKATIVAQNRGDKVIIFKKRRRQKSRTKNGHRQLQSVLKITAIDG
jgi:large subunit ribosomal protein L21